MGPNSFQLAMGLKIVGYPALAAAIGLVIARLLPAGSRFIVQQFVNYR